MPEFTLNLLYWMIAIGLVASVCLWYLNGCKHKYKTIDNFSRKSFGYTSHVYVQECLHCGKIKRKEVK